MSEQKNKNVVSLGNWITIAIFIIGMGGQWFNAKVSEAQFRQEIQSELAAVQEDVHELQAVLDAHNLVLIDYQVKEIGKKIDILINTAR